MNSVPTDGGAASPHEPRSAPHQPAATPYKLGTAPRRGQLNLEVKKSLRELGIQLSQLNQNISARIDLKATDLRTLDLIGRYGPISPSALAKRAGMHPATTTGVLDRLERGGWIERGRDPSDRRGVVVQ